MTFRAEGLDRLIADLTGAPLKVTAQSRRIVQQSCATIKRDAQAFAPRGPHLPAYAESITYETHDTAHGADGEVGPDKDRAQGALGNLIEYGSVHNAPFAHLGPAFDLEQPRFVDAFKRLDDGL